MIRGCQRRIYHVKNPGGEIFEEAYFVLRRDYSGRGTLNASDGDLAKEALRIADQTCGVPASGGIREKVVPFVVGASAAVTAIGAAVFLFLR